MAEFIRKKQSEGEFFGYQYPVNLKGSHLIVMAVAIGLKKIAQDIGYEPKKDEGEGEEKKTKTTKADRDFLEKLMGG
ncbi:MAG TPA: hypothetical protein EYP32_03945 [Aquificaceae bacterium]|nr:hypothetical protein [Aquificaceae bacterium]